MHLPILQVKILRPKGEKSYVQNQISSLTVKIIPPDAQPCRVPSLSDSPYHHYSSWITVAPREPNHNQIPQSTSIPFLKSNFTCLYSLCICTRILNQSWKIIPENAVVHPPRPQPIAHSPQIVLPLGSYLPTCSSFPHAHLRLLLYSRSPLCNVNWVGKDCMEHSCLDMFFLSAGNCK